MIVTEESVILTLPPSKTPRSPGQHVSGIIRCLATEMGILTPDTAEELSLTDVRTITDPVAILRIRIGLAWEEHYIPSLEDVVDHPGEMFHDGVYMTHDGESISSVYSSVSLTHSWELVVHEVKATYKSTKTVGDLSSQWMWLTQMKAYCKAKNTRFAKMHCLFLCGDYKMPIQPVLKIWAIEFTQEEIDMNWTVLKQYQGYREEIEGK